jgi:vacuolar-type H+-ATPase subunit F/Vma7
MVPIQIIGDADTVLAFDLGGIPGQVAETAEAAYAAVESVVSDLRHNGGLGRRPALLLVTHGVAGRVRDELDRLILDPNAPLVLEIPGAGEPLGESPVERFVERVLGIEL